MQRFRRNYRFNRVVLLAVALLVSNIAAMSCAMAYSLCDDCPEHTPVLCVDSCATGEAVISDQSLDTESDHFRPVSISDHASPADADYSADQFLLVENRSPDPQSSPPLHLLLCVFLK
jgi:hypothetical protein